MAITNIELAALVDKYPGDVWQRGTHVTRVKIEDSSLYLGFHNWVSTAYIFKNDHDIFSKNRDVLEVENIDSELIDKVRRYGLANDEGKVRLREERQLQRRDLIFTTRDQYRQLGNGLEYKDVLATISKIPMNSWEFPHYEPMKTQHEHFGYKVKVPEMVNPWIQELTVYALDFTLPILKFTSGNLTDETRPLVSSMGRKLSSARTVAHGEQLEQFQGLAQAMVLAALKK